MNYTIILKCENVKDAEKFDRCLDINNYESATATFKMLTKSVLEDLIDPYTLEFYYRGTLRYRLESLKV